MRRRRARAVVRWGCTLAALVVLGAAVFSLFRSAQYVSVSSDRHNWWALEVSGGQLVFTRVVGYQWTHFEETWKLIVSERSPWSWGMNSDDIAGSVWRGGFLWRWPGVPTDLDAFGVTLLYPFLLTAVPAAFLWYANRRRPDPGQCAACGYDRRGLAPVAACPECGTVPAA